MSYKKGSIGPHMLEVSGGAAGLTRGCSEVVVEPSHTIGVLRSHSSGSSILIPVYRILGDNLSGVRSGPLSGTREVVRASVHASQKGSSM